MALVLTNRPQHYGLVSCVILYPYSVEPQWMQHPTPSRRYQPPTLLSASGNYPVNLLPAKNKLSIDICYRNKNKLSIDICYRSRGLVFPLTLWYSVAQIEAKGGLKLQFSSLQICEDPLSCPKGAQPWFLPDSFRCGISNKIVTFPKGPCFSSSPR